MKKVITTVGASLFDNYIEDGFKEDRSSLEALERRPHNDWESCRERVERLRSSVINWARRNYNQSAEIKSTRKILKYYKTSLDIYLLSTDTVLCRLATELVAELLKKTEGNINVYFNPSLDVIPGLQVSDQGEFVTRGLCNLINRINQIAGGDIDNEGYYKDIVFNITGGYKAVIPYMATMAIVNGCDMAYIFQDTESLIRIPRAPLRLDYELFKDYQEEIAKLHRIIEDYNSQRNRRYIELEERGLVEASGNIAQLSPLGMILYRRYLNKYFVFYVTSEVWETIKSNVDINRIIKNKFSHPQIRENKTELKGNKHKKKIYDDGDNPYRIAYQEEGGYVYIYKVFTSEPDQVKYLETDEPLDIEEIKRKSTIKIMEKQNVPKS